MGEFYNSPREKSFADLGHSGGIRGIIELEVLKHIEDALGGLPIRCFFDLIVGTRFVLKSRLTTHTAPDLLTEKPQYWRADSTGSHHHELDCR